MKQDNAPKANVFLANFKRAKFSRPQLVIFVLAFGLIGYLIFKSFATAPLVASLEAEQMSLPSNASVITDTTASGGKAVLLPTSGSTSGSVNFPSSVTSLSIIAKGTQCNGAPAMNVTLDGAMLLSNTAVSSTSWSSFTATPANTITSGTHNFSIAFINDYTKTKGNPHNQCSRALYLDVSSFYGPTPAPTPAPTVSLSATPTSVSIGAASTLTWTSTDATSCAASGAWSGTEPTSGSVSTGAINTASVYTLTCSGAGGSASASAAISISNTSAFTTSLTQGMTITPPYTWTFNPGVSSVKGYFWADGVLLGSATPDSSGKYSFTIQATTLTVGTHTLGHAWDLADGTHQTGPTGYSVTIAGSPTGTTDNSSFSAATNYSAPAFTAIRTIDVSSQSAFMTAWNNIQPGDLIKVHGVTFSGEISLLGKYLTSDAEIDFDSATKFLGPTSNLYPAVWLNNDSHIRLFGGDITSLGTGIEISGGSNYLWYGFNVHNTGAAGVFLTGAYTLVDNADIKGEVSYWSLDNSLDPHAEKGTGLHGINVADSKYGVKNSRIALYAHDGPGGAGMEIGGSGSSDGAWNNTIYMHCVNLTMHAISQVAGNCVQVWGDNVLNNNFKYIEAENLQGRPYDANGLYSGQSLSSNTVNYGIASNTNLNTLLSSTESSIPANMHWDTRGGTVFQTVSPKP